MVLTKVVHEKDHSLYLSLSVSRVHSPQAVALHPATTCGEKNDVEKLMKV
jgi:hypothetical protein